MQKKTLNIKKILIGIAFAIFAMACGQELAPSTSPLAEETPIGEPIDGVGINSKETKLSSKGTPSGLGKFALQALKDSPGAQTPAFSPMAVSFGRLTEIDVYGILRNVTDYTHRDADVNVALPYSRTGQTFFPYSAGIANGGRLEASLEVTATGAVALLYPINMCNFGGTNGHSYYPDGMFGAPHATFWATRSNNGPIHMLDYTVPNSNANFAICNKPLYRITLNVRGEATDPITAGTEVREFNTKSWDAVQNDFIYYEVTTANGTGDGRLITFQTTQADPVLLRCEHETANPLWDWRICPDVTIHLFEVWQSNGTWQAVPACVGTALTGAFDLNQDDDGDPATTADVDEGYLARFDTTVAGCITQSNTGFTVEFQ